MKRWILARPEITEMHACVLWTSSCWSVITLHHMTTLLPPAELVSARAVIRDVSRVHVILVINFGSSFSRSITGNLLRP